MALLGLDSPGKKFIFLFYMVLWSALRLIIYGSKKAGSSYNQTSLLVFVSVAKLLIAFVMYLREDGGVGKLVEQVKATPKLFMRYFLPALSYVVYDNLTFANLTYSDPVTYVILMQMRIGATGVMWQTFFSRPLNKNQWMAIAVLTLACMLQKGGAVLSKGSSDAETARGHLILSLGLIGMQIACGVFSSVFNELLLKEKGAVGTNLQNMYMYTHSIFCNVVWLLLCPSKTYCSGDLWEALSRDELLKLMRPWVLPIGCIMAVIGIVTSLFIKYLDSVRKTIASAIEIFVDAVLSYLLFGVPLTFTTVVACGLASGGIMLYSKPVQAPPPKPEADEVTVVTDDARSRSEL
eukprot:TRINITY_DN8557_c0_g1_i1.p1 TRINITY_DN8557_c0_g1~~TRINITY_DN8557_c0_g1_i1.p1  ORF type:complete len:375 (+),score=133.76 TRINITY_DN8557_c0_g1_i1:78-1127(+)